MKKTVLLALLVFMFTIACKKDKTTPQPKVKTKTTGGVTETYTYDEQGRLKVTYVSSSTYHDSIIYRTDSLLHYSVSSSGVATFSYALPLNAQGLVKGSYGLIRSESYFYNSDGFKTLTLISDILSSEKDTNHISNNNIIKSEIQSSGILTSSSTVSNFTFSDKTNSLTAESLGLQVFGKLNKNLISTSVVT